MTVDMSAAIAQLRLERRTILDADLASVSPARSKPINRYGKYTFNLQEALQWDGLRPLRTPPPHNEGRSPPVGFCSVANGRPRPPGPTKQNP